jgi:heme exporter protein C
MSGLISKLRRYEGAFGVAAGLFLASGLYFAWVASPPDYYQGEVVRIMYIHVPFAKSSLLAYIVLFAGSLWYLWKRDPVVDNLCHAAAGVGLFFTSVALVTGSIWAKPTWNTWWTWDPKLTAFAVLLMVQAGYLMLRSFVDDPDREARYAAVLAIIGFVDLPIVYLAAKWWRTLHQPLSISTRGLSLSPDMLLPLLLMSIGTSLLLSYLLMIRTQMLYLERLLAAKQERFLGQATTQDPISSP